MVFPTIKHPDIDRCQPYINCHKVYVERNNGAFLNKSLRDDFDVRCSMRTKVHSNNNKQHTAENIYYKSSRKFILRGYAVLKYINFYS